MRSPSWPVSRRGALVYRDTREDRQNAPALHGAKMQTTQRSYPVVVWALSKTATGPMK
jgi:hypothetical protein